MSSDALNLFSRFFNALWSGLKQVDIPGTSWSIAEVFIAILIAGLVGLVLKIAFKLFSTHLGRGTGSRNRRAAAGKGYKDE